MKKEEKKVLVEVREGQGKTKEKAWKEVEEFEKSQRAYKKLYRENKALKRELIKLEDGIGKLKDKVFKLSLQKDAAKLAGPRIIKTNGNLKNIARIKNHMKVGLKYTKSALSRELCMKKADAEAAMIFIRKNGLLDIEETRGEYRRLK